MCNDQLCGLSSSMMHGAEIYPIIAKSIMLIAAGTNTQQNVGEYGSDLNQD